MEMKYSSDNSVDINRITRLRITEDGSFDTTEFELEV
jgi:hypothetical protein